MVDERTTLESASFENIYLFISMIFLHFSLEERCTLLIIIIIHIFVFD